MELPSNLPLNSWLPLNRGMDLMQCLFDYILKAISKASDLKKLFQIKSELRNNFLKSPLSNAKQYAKNFENCLNSMWKTYLEKK